MDIKKINYKSDFTLRMHSDAGWGTGFRIRFRASGSPQKRYCACHDGNGKYCSCHVDAADPSTLVVEFDDHHMGIGVLLCEITYSVADESSPTGKFDTVVNEAPVVATIGGKEYKVILGIDGDESAEIIYELPAYVAEEQRQAAEAERQEAEAGREEAEAVRQELAAHPLYVGEDYFVYQYDLASHEYQNTGVYLKGSVSIEGFVYVSETETHTTYSIIFSDGTTESVDIPKGAKGDKGDTGNTGPQGAQGPKGDTVTATDYTLYNVQGSDSQGAMSQDATTKAISAQTGYYTCGTAAGTPEKVVTVESGNLYKRTLGGHFKVQMKNKNTAASGVTLQIGSETAAALWYNGAAASANNSWDAGEVLSVYYDGTYYQASNAQGGSSKKIDAYLYGDLKTLAVGQTYEKDTAIKTTDKQLRRITKEIKALSLSETLASGDIRVSSPNTYRAASAVNTYDSSATYSAGAYALGSMTVYTLTVTADSVAAGNITVNGIEVAVETTDDADSIASKISSALNIDGWTDSVSNNVVTVRCNTIGNNTTTITITDTDSTGVVVNGTSTPTVTGTSVIRKYDGESWADATPSRMIEDGILVSVDGAWLLTNATAQNSVTKDISAAVIYEEAVNISAIPNVYCGMFYNQSKWWWTNSNNNGKFLPVKAGEVYTIVANGSREVNCGLLKDNTHVEGEVTNFATGETGRVINPNNSITITVPSDATYLYFRTTARGSVDRTPSRISVLHNFHDFRAKCEENFDDLYDKVDVNETNIKSAQEFPSFTITDRTPINLANYQQQNCAFGSNNKWYYTQQAGRHKAIPVSPGDQFIIKPSVTSYIGWLTNYYNPPYTNGADVPWVTGRGREEINQQMIIEAPMGALWLIVTTRDGSGLNVNWSIDRCNATNKELGFLKFRYASWNIGHFSYYDGSEGTYNPTIPANKVEEMSIRYKRIINDVSADVFGVAEYDPYFDANNTVSAASKIFPCYGGQFIGTKYSYNCNAVFLNNNKFLNASTGGVTFSPSQAGQTRYYKWVKCFLSGIEVYIVSTHLDFSPSEYRAAQMETLITRFSTCPHVIISGDFNTNINAEADMQLFIDAGYTLANGGYIGYSNTSRDNYPLDHICVKGFRMDNIQVNEESWTLSDHKLISCDLTLL